MEMLHWFWKENILSAIKLVLQHVPLSKIDNMTNEQVIVDFKLYHPNSI